MEVNISVDGQSISNWIQHNPKKQALTELAGNQQTISLVDALYVRVLIAQFAKVLILIVLMIQFGQLW